MEFVAYMYINNFKEKNTNSYYMLDIQDGNQSHSIIRWVTRELVLHFNFLARYLLTIWSTSNPSSNSKTPSK